MLEAGHHWSHQSAKSPPEHTTLVSHPPTSASFQASEKHCFKHEKTANGSQARRSYLSQSNNEIIKPNPNGPHILSCCGNHVTYALRLMSSITLVLQCSSVCSDVSVQLKPFSLESSAYTFMSKPLSILTVSSYSGLRSCDTNSLLHLNLHFAQAIMSWLRIVLLYSYFFSNCLVILLCFRRSDIFSCCTCTSIFDLVYLFQLHCYKNWPAYAQI